MDEETINVQELAQALIRLHLSHTIAASDVFADAKKFREPQWKVGDVVVDANDVPWRRVTGQMWHRFGYHSTFPHTRPDRPLTRIAKETNA